MATNTRTKTAASPEPNDPNDSLLVSLDELVGLAQAHKAQAQTQKAQGPAAAPIVWGPAVVAAAAALPVPIELPNRYPAKGPGAQLPEPAWVSGPKCLGALDAPACPERRNDPLLAAIRAAVLNDWHGRKVHSGRSAAEGGRLPVQALLLVLATHPSQQKARKWAQVLVGSGQTNLLAQVANVAGRFAVLRPEGITLVRDFYAPNNAQ